MSTPLTFRWLGTAGIELCWRGATLAIDPFFTRPGPVQVALGRSHPNEGLVREHLPACDFVLVSHPHYDHLMDVPVVMNSTAAHAYGSANTCRLLESHSLPPERIHPIKAGARLELGPFTVEVFSATHVSTPLNRWANGSLPARLEPPVRLRDFRMDENFAFLVQVDGLSLLAGAAPCRADVFWVNLINNQSPWQELLGQVQPRLLIPNHWDDFTRPLGKPILPMVAISKRGWPQLKRLDLASFQRQAERILPGVRVLLPVIFNRYDLLAIMNS